MAMTGDQERIAESIRRVRDHLEQHPDDARSTDSTARAVISGGLRAVVTGPESWRIETDMTRAVGGEGSAPSPGWVLRAALASCDATLIAMQAAEEGVTLERLEVETVSESDDRGLIGPGEVPAGPLSVRTRVRIQSPGAGRERLEQLVERALRRSPVADALERSVPVSVEIVS